LVQFKFTLLIYLQPREQRTKYHSWP